MCETWEGGLWVFSGANGNFGWGAACGGESDLGLCSLNYINIYLYLCVPGWGRRKLPETTSLTLPYILHKGLRCEEFTWIAVAHWLFIYLNKMVYKLFSNNKDYLGISELLGEGVGCGNLVFIPVYFLMASTENDPHLLHEPVTVKCLQLCSISLCQSLWVLLGHGGESFLR